MKYFVKNIYFLTPKRMNTFKIKAYIIVSAVIFDKNAFL